MKKAVIWMLLALGLSTPVFAEQPQVELDQLFEADGVFYLRQNREPFTGVAVAHHYNGGLKSEAHFENGLKHGAETTWYSNGSVHREMSFKHGEPDGIWMSWSRDDEILFYRTYEDGKRIQG